MRPVDKVIWYIESHYRQAITLDMLAESAGVSRVFPIDRHISAIRALWHTIWSEWLPGSEYEAADAPVVERYPESFDPETGMGGFELWLPVKLGQK